MWSYKLLNEEEKLEDKINKLGRYNSTMRKEKLGQALRVLKTQAEHASAVSKPSSSFRTYQTFPPMFINREA